jgi:hypothetical protein
VSAAVLVFHRVEGPPGHGIYVIAILHLLTFPIYPGKVCRI